VEECSELLSSGQPYFPREYLEIESLSAKVPCMNASSDNIPSKFECPEPLVYDSELKYCTAPCPAPLYSRYEISVYNIVTGVLGALSMVANCKLFSYQILHIQKVTDFYRIMTVIVVLTYGLNPRLRKMPGVIIFWLSFSLLLYDISLSTSLITISVASFPDLFHFLAMSLGAASETDVLPYCKSATEFGDRSNNYCGANFFLATVGGLGGAVWFLIVALNLFLMLYFDFK